MSCVGQTNFRPKLKNNKQTQRDEVHGTYPYEEVGLIVIGPETIASRDGWFINWRGTLYRRVDDIGQVDPLEIK